MTVNFEKILGRAAIYDTATPEYPVHVKAHLVSMLKVLNPTVYNNIQKKVHSGAYILEA